MRILEGMKNATMIENANQSGRRAETKALAENAQSAKSADISNVKQKPQQNQSAIQSNNSKHIIIPNYRPYANAIYDFASKQIGDLSFTKGDKILLKHRIDMNWYIGECNGCEGAFPANHVQVIVPLPLPQCKALYDFRMVPNEEEGCLTFRKGEIINVFCRVDQNWAEGRIDDCIGIFPIAFVEMNMPAKQLIENSSRRWAFHYSKRELLINRSRAS